MIERATTSLCELYEADETAWLEAMADLIRQHRWDELDYTHLGEYLTDTARRDRREMESRLTTLRAHVLKGMHPPEHRSRSWHGSIIEQQQELEGAAARGVLRNHAGAVLSGCYARAVKRAAAETGLAASTFATECPFTLEQILAPGFPGDVVGG